MAAFRRAAALAGKLNLWSSTKSELLGAPNMHGRRTRRCLAAGLCAAAGGALALYFYNEIWSGRKRMRRRSINGLPLPSIPTVEAKEKWVKCVTYFQHARWKQFAHCLDAVEGMALSAHAGAEMTTRCRLAPRHSSHTMQLQTCQASNCDQ
ncbi:hypothetical protein ILYODFUR_027204 [Ilyodon furcidens]|uniref:Uncharacterized protein n=1 Tax=Ilyodon furcidens TaxID=33524 RepID=A0ABV0ULQ1_9TELE